MITLQSVTGWSGAERIKYFIEEQSYTSYLSWEAPLVPGRVSVYSWMSG